MSNTVGLKPYPISATVLNLRDSDQHEWGRISSLGRMRVRPFLNRDQAQIEAERVEARKWRGVTDERPLRRGHRAMVRTAGRTAAPPRLRRAGQRGRDRLGERGGGNRGRRQIGGPRCTVPSPDGAVARSQSRGVAALAGSAALAGGSSLAP